MKNTKTIRQFLETLEEPYRSRAIENTNEFGNELSVDVLDEPAFDLQDALMSCFIWADSPEGFKYWNNLCKKLFSE